MQSAAAPADVLDLSVVVVNYNVREFLEQALRSVFRAGEHLSMEVFVVDNNSVDGSAAMVRAEFPSVRLLVNDENVGFSRANNQAIHEARGRYLLILNPDTIVQEDTFSKLIRFMDSHPEAGAVGCKILHPDGSFARESRRAFPTPRVAFYRLVGLSALFPGSRTFGRYNMTYLPENEVAEVDALSGSCMLVRKDALYQSRTGGGSGAGLLDESFFMYGEDLDWCYRIQRAGWKIYYTPETQIIHYKGESTKKGELKYVRLFYGAMLQFSEKHLEGRYSRFFALLVRIGIVFRAVASLLAKAFRRFSWPLVDFGTVYACAAAVGSVHAMLLGADPAPLFFAVVAPAYGLGTIMGTAVAGGYGHRRRIRSVWAGVLVGMLLVASTSFFIKDIAFSRVVVLVTFPLAATTASLLRLMYSRRGENPAYRRRAVVVGQRAEAARLQQMLLRHPRPPFRLEGYIASDRESVARNGRHAGQAPSSLGHLGQLRDIVRIHQIDDVVFASAALSNQDIFRLIQQVRDLPVHFRILAEGRDHVIGKASVDDLSLTSLVEAEEALIHRRSHLGRRAFEIALSIFGLAIYPLMAAAAAASRGESMPALVRRKLSRLPEVLRGRLALVGYNSIGDYIPPEEWGLRSAVFAVHEALDVAHATREEIGAAYWFYVRNQSASLDWDIIVRSLRQLRHRTQSSNTVSR